MVDDVESRKRILIAAAAAYARQFRRVPQSDARAVEDELEREAPDLLTTVNEALFHHSIEAFVDAVRRELVR